MNIGLVVAAYNSGRDLVRLVKSADHIDNLHIELILHSADTATVDACEEVASKYDCTFHDLRRNAGLSRAWNTGVLNSYAAGADIVIIANDDVVFGEGDLARLARYAVANPHRFMVVCGGFHERFETPVESHGYSCFALNPIALEVLGCFDENLFPAYFEDCDYHYRAALAGLSPARCPDTAVSHVGSGTIFRDSTLNANNHKTFSANQEYYQRKWGAGNDYEKFKTPFDDSRFTLRIAPEQRHTPYGYPFDRVNPELEGIAP